MFNIVDIIPELLITFIIMINLALFIRFLSEGLSISTAVRFHIRTYKFFSTPYFILRYKNDLLEEIEQMSMENDVREALVELFTSKRKLFMMFVNNYRMGIDFMVWEAKNFEEKKRKSGSLPNYQNQVEPFLLFLKKIMTNDLQKMLS
jgi:hypothetical protein